MTASVLIIGGSSGIGKALAQHYSAEGACVTVISRQAKPAQVSYYWYQDSLTCEAESEQVVKQALAQQPDTIFICNGVLHDEKAMPEKTIRQLESAVLM